ncbi:CoA thiolase [Seminavis robusta]|uniref:acetyl-CoA C-acyltransferase n=1 Tax=Seminavis robusta TaxID=568900 RepID=A0A9N8E0R9_9STRA|nr:CoA thiolase [Seminavis robusta]|eukprot:Sro421_g139530.1 CoA thiolase (388) ;mRNA; f:28443-29606
MNSDDDVVIVSALRTPMCRSRKGALAKVFPHTLLQTVLEATVSRTNNKLSANEIEDICVGNVLMPPSGFAAMRMAQITAGIPETVSLHSVNRQCASGLEAVAQIASAIATKQIDIGVGAGVESMSTYPMNKMKPPEMDWSAVQDNTTAMDCLVPMGITSENVVKKYGLSRRPLDEFSALSHQKAARAQQTGKFNAEIVPVGSVSKDDGIRPGTTVERLSKLKPVFDENGVTTAGNSSQTTDGAAAVLLTTRKEAKSRGLPILGIWRGYATKGVPPRIMGVGPAYAIPAVLEKTGLSVDDIDVFEINEAFASQATWSIEKLGIPAEKVNPNGGAIALGHPLGCTGARMVATLLHEMHRSKKRFGVISMCIGTGMGAAAVLEVEPSSRL